MNQLTSPRPARHSAGIQKVPYELRETPEKVEAWLRSQHATGALSSWDEKVTHYPDGTVKVRVMLTEPRLTRDDGRAFALAERAAIAGVVTAGCVGTVLLASAVLALASAAGADGVVLAAVVLAALLLGGGGTACAGLHCAGCSR